MSAADPFGTSELRAGVLAAWRDSPTRLREDAATEADLVRAGYRDRLLTELAQNAADAAAKAGVPGRVTVRLDGRTLHIANTGAPLDLAGVHALTALRASGKADTNVGRFGVGFTAVLSVSDDIEVRSTTGSLHFSRARTAQALRDNQIQIPGESNHRTETAAGERASGGPAHRTETAAGERSEWADQASDGPADRTGTAASERSEWAGQPSGGPAADIRCSPDPAAVEPADPQTGAGGAATSPQSHESASYGASYDSATADPASLQPNAAVGVPAHGPEFAPPTLRLVWPSNTEPEVGTDTEVVLRLRDDADAEALLDGMRAEAADLLLELPALQCIRIGDEEIVSAVRVLDGGLQELRIDGPGMELRIWWQYKTSRARWLLPVRAGRPVPSGNDVLRAPTRSDEELSLPAILIADIPMQPDRRRLLPGARIAELASGYAHFARALPPGDRLVLVPTPGFARSEADGLLREVLIRELQTSSWLPVCPGRQPLDTPSGVHGWPDPLDPTDDEPVPGRADDTPVPGGVEAEPVPGRAEDTPARGGMEAEPVSGRVDDMPAGGGVAAERAQGPIAVPNWNDSVLESSGTASARVDASNSAHLGSDWHNGLFEPSALAAPRSASSGALATAVPTRASVFAGLTAELAELLDDVVGPLVIPELSGRSHAEALGVLDVHRLGLARLAELSSGLEREPGWWRRLYAALEPFVVDPLTAEELGALAVPLADGRLVTGPRTVVLDDQLEMAIPVHWARLVHPEAAHPLLARLGARSATAEDLLGDPALRAELTDRPDDEDTLDAVLRLAVHANPAALPSWLGLLELPDTAGELRPADELLLPDAPLYPLLVADAPLGTVDPAVVEAYGAEALRAIGVGWGFSVVTEVDPTGPDHQLDDEARWWAGLAEDPPELAAVRDLDLVDEVAWPDALLQLVSEPDTRRLLADPNGYTAWWLRGHARIDGTPLGLLRHPADNEFAGLLDEFAFEGFGRTDLDALRAVFADPANVSPELAAALLEALADPTKTPGPQVIARAHGKLAAAIAADRLDVADLALPDRVRSLAGAVIDPSDALILDQPEFALALPSQRLVFGGTEHASALATLLDLPVVSAAVTAEVLGEGRRTAWADAPLGVILREMLTLPTPDGDLVLHDELRVRLGGAVQGTVEVPWWRAGTTTHVRVPEGR
ncbi:sacsin N-terminal ATP-binding-like domain-containing protein [Nocardia goodfellowii]|uniref:Molecular chaperone Hsp90 n=1 Tax=Nocardia goodfellowii TaxID=882446 RepID=A0ABS4Q7B6_9NOCA|nr:ATP-binding protein [Nocardia goodfellowii]MBP2187576.1 hypothetical protein [Nocardia goodfellowii]